MMHCESTRLHLFMFSRATSSVMKIKWNCIKCLANIFTLYIFVLALSETVSAETKVETVQLKEINGKRLLKVVHDLPKRNLSSIRNPYFIINKNTWGKKYMSYKRPKVNLRDHLLPQHKSFLKDINENKSFVRDHKIGIPKLQKTPWKKNDESKDTRSNSFKQYMSGVVGRKKRTGDKKSWFQPPSWNDGRLILRNGLYEGLTVAITDKISQDDCRTVLEGLKVCYKFPHLRFQKENNFLASFLVVHKLFLLHILSLE